MKKLAFSLIAAMFMCVSANAQDAPKNFMKIDLGFGKISNYDGSCSGGMGMCGGQTTNPTFLAAISRVSETQVSIAMSRTFYQNNVHYLDKGLEVGARFSLPRAITEKIGLSGEFIVPAGTYQVSEKDGVYYMSVPRER